MFVLFRGPLLAVMLVLGTAGARAGETLAGPIPADILQVIDGDSVRVRARIWPGQTVTVTVRLLGIDTPELRAKCASERTRAVAARACLAARLESGAIELRDIRFGKYSGRVLARISTSDGKDASALMLRSGYARPYAGRKRAGWCDLHPDGILR